MRLRDKQIRSLCHIGHAIQSFHITGLGCVDKGEISEDFRQGMEEALSLPYSVCTSEDLYRLRKITEELDMVSICHQYLNLVTHYVIWHRFDASDSLEDSAIRHGISKNENRTPRCIAGG